MKKDNNKTRGTYCRLKRFFSMLLCIVLVIGLLPVADVRADNGIVYVGDVDGDGEVTPKDVTMLRRYLAKGWNVDVDTEDGDVDGDGNITPKDVTMLRRYLAKGWGVKLPEKSNSIIPEDVIIDKNSFPDDIFRRFVIDNYDVDKNGILSTEEIISVKKINCRPSQYTELSYDPDNYSESWSYDSIIAQEEYKFHEDGKGIKTLKGIEYFPELEELDVRCNQITEIDLSKNINITSLDCSYNEMTRVDLTHNGKLEVVLIYDNKLTQINTGNNKNMLELDCECNQLTEIDVTGCPNLESLWCYNNKLNSLNIRGNDKLVDLDCENNELKTLDISTNKSLKYLYCEGNQIKELDITNTRLDEGTLSCDEDVIIKTHVHSWVLVQKQETTDAEIGYEKYQCEECGTELLGRTPVEGKIVFDSWKEYVSVGGTDEKLYIPDSKLKDIITQAVSDSGKTLKEEGELWKSDVYDLTRIGDIESEVTDITGLGELVNLESLNIHSIVISDISELASLINLTNLYIQNTEIKDVKPLGSLKKLKFLDIHGSRYLKNIEPLSRLVNLMTLSVADCQSLTDITPIMGLSNLTRLDISNTGVSILTGIESLNNLTSLDMVRINVSDISPIYSIEGLTRISVDVDNSLLKEICQKITTLNSISLNGNGKKIDVSPIRSLFALQELDINDAVIDNVDLIGDMTNLRSLSLCHDGLEDISFISDLTNLTYLNISKNKISDITPVKSLAKITLFGAADNDIIDVSPLKELTDLEYLELYGNKKLEDVSDLSQLTKLWYLDLRVTAVSEEGEQILKTALPNTLIYVSQATGNPIHEDPYVENNDAWEQYIAEGGVDEKIEFKDAVLKQKIISAVINSGKSLKEENELWRSDVYGLKYLNTDIDDTVKDLTGLGELVNLRDLNILHNYEIKDISEVSKLKNLNTLMLQYTGIEDISPIRDLDNLNWLIVSGCTQVKDFGVISSLDSLRTLDVHDCAQLTDITPFLSITGLCGLYISGTGVTSLDGIDDLTLLNSLSIQNTAISDISPIYELSDRMISLSIDVDSDDMLKEICENLPLLTDISINAKGNEMDITPVKDLTNLTRLAFSNAVLTNTAFIGGLEGLTSISLVNDGIEDISFVENLSDLNYLNIIDNKVSDLTPMRGLSKLKTFVAYNNLITDISPLESLYELGMISLNQNRGLTSVSCLKGLNNLWNLELAQTSVPESEIQELKRVLPYVNIIYSMAE